LRSPNATAPAIVPAAWARRNCVQVGPPRRGAGPGPWVRRIARTEVADTATPSLRHSPTIRTYPHLGFSFAIRTTNFCREDLRVVENRNVPWCQIRILILRSQSHQKIRRQRENDRVRIPNGQAYCKSQRFVLLKPDWHSR
jgi:hypothetical protein